MALILLIKGAVPLVFLPRVKVDNNYSKFFKTIKIIKKIRLIIIIKKIWWTIAIKIVVILFYY